MHKWSVSPDHVDERGTITDLVCEPLNSATLIHTRQHAIRGNHYHRDTHQWAYVVSGMLAVVTRKAGKVTEGTVGVGEVLYSPPMEEHAWRALTDTTVIVLTRGPRSGPGYESDTHRLAEHDRLI